MDTDICLMKNVVKLEIPGKERVGIPGAPRERK